MISLQKISLSYFIILFFIASKLISKSATVHVFGDSHSFAFKNIEGCEVHYCQDVTMHRIGRDELSCLDLREFNVNDNDVVIFVFGEIDVRCHIGKQQDIMGRSLNEIIDTLVVKYVATIAKNNSFFKNLHCIIYTVVPPTDAGGNNPQFPFYGKLEDRVVITRKLNARIEDECKKYNFSVLNIYNEYSDNNGILNLTYSDGHVHIRTDCNQKIKDKLANVLGKVL